MTLHRYWRSTASHRLRIALALKGIPYEQATYDLQTGAHKAPDYLALNGQGLVPALETDGGVLTQSSAILEWLEEQYPSPALLPEMSGDRAIVRGMAGIVCCDIHKKHTCNRGTSTMMTILSTTINNTIEGVDLFSDETLLNPFPVYAAIRDMAPAVWLPRHRCWAMGRYADVRRALARHTVFRSGQGIGLTPEANETTRGAILTSDPPVHGHLRGVLNERMSPAGVGKRASIN